MDHTPAPWFRPWALLMLVLAGATSACSIVSGSVETAEPLRPVGTQPPLLPATAGFTVVNDTGETICFLYVAPTSAFVWGDDWLSSTGSIESGESRSFEVTPGVYDLRAEDCDTVRLGEVSDVSVWASGYTWSLPFVPVTVRLVNASNIPICYVYIDPGTGPSGGNWLGSDAIITPHTSRDFAVPPGQEYYLRAHSCNRNIMDEQRRIPITTDIYTWTISEP